jgi:hypothetical protein
VYHLPNGLCIDNRWVVPYNRALLLKYNAHINVEVCGSIYAVKYLHKYVHKGGDRAEVEYVPNATEALDGHDAGTSGLPSGLHDHDEVHQYQEGRYLSTSEAVWRAFSFPLQSGGLLSYVSFWKTAAFFHLEAIAIGKSHNALSLCTVVGRCKPSTLITHHVSPSVAQLSATPTF